MRIPLLLRLLSAYAVPMAALVVLAPWLAWRVASQSLEEQVGQRLVASANVIARSLLADTLVTLQPGDDGNRTHRNQAAKLEALREAAALRRVYVFSPDDRLLVATGDALPIGSPMPELERDRLELMRVRAGEPAYSSVTFIGTDGQTYKSGYAPVYDAAGRVVALVGVDASAGFFEVLSRFGASMFLLAILFGVVGGGLFFLAGNRWLLAPIRRLRDAADAIGRGELARPVPVLGSDELGVLGSRMEEMREKLYAREREQQMMLAGIAHEVRNPLGGIDLFAGLLADELRDDAEKREYVGKIQRELKYLGRVVEDFLDFAREPKLTREELDVRVLLHEIAELARPEADARGHTIEIDAPESIRVLADAATLRRAFLNLVRNAVQICPEGARIRLIGREIGGRIELCVEDDGPGVPPEARAQLFTPFFTTREKGLGLGLALVRRIAEAHGGTARLAESEQGAAFVVELPAR